MDYIGTRILEAFWEFPRPESIVIHTLEDECFDCTDVEELELCHLDCKRILEDSSFKFATMPMDCLNAKAFLHYLPAIVPNHLNLYGISVAETVAWILGADEWDTDLTISEQIKPMLSVHQYNCVRDYLNVLDGSAFCEQARNKSGEAAKRNWETLCHSNWYVGTTPLDTTCPLTARAFMLR